MDLVSQKVQHLGKVLNTPVAGRILGHGRGEQMTGFAAGIVTGFQIANAIADHNRVLRSATVFFHQIVNHIGSGFVYETGILGGDHFFKVIFQTGQF